MATTAADILRAEAMIASSWPALNVCLSGRWLLGMADGVSGRANSLFFLDHKDDTDYAARLDWMEETYRRAGLPPRARLSPLAPLKVIRELQSRGYIFRNPTLTLRRDLRDFTLEETGSGEIVTSSSCTPQWLDTFIECSPRYRSSRKTIEKMLAAIMDKTRYFLAFHEGQPVSTAMSVEHVGCMTIQNVATRADFQRRGFARAAMENTLATAAQNGVSWCWLAVEKENTPAIALYRNLGFEDFYSYIYASLDA